MANRAVYFYDSNLQLVKQGSILENEGLLSYSEDAAVINQGDINQTRLVVALPLATFSGGFPTITFRTPKGYTSAIQSMSQATWLIDSVNYQVFYIDMTTVNWTFSAGRHAFMVGYMINSGFSNLELSFYTVSDGVNAFEDTTADNYEEIYTALYATFDDLASRLTNVEDYLANGFNFNELTDYSAATGIDRIIFYSADGTAVLSFDGTNLLLNRNAVDEEVMTVLNEIGDLANVVETGLAADDILIYNGTNWVNITKTAYLAAVNGRIDTNVSDIADRELISNKVDEVVVGGTTDQYVNAEALYTKFLTKVDKAFTIAGLDMQSGSITLSALKTAIGEATTSANGLLSASDKTLIDVVRASIEDDDAGVLVDTIKEVLAAFDGYPESTDLMTYLATKVDKVAGKELSENDLTDVLKGTYDDAVVHANTTDGTNPHVTTYANIVSKPTTFEGFGLANGSAETFEATTHVKTPKVVLATGVYIEYDDVNSQIKFVIE